MKMNGSCAPKDDTPDVRQTRSRLRNIGQSPLRKQCSCSVKETENSCSSSPSTITSSLIKRVEAEAWVQCEKPNCLKWRRITKHVADKLSETEPWFCSMNQDPLRNKCEALEDDYKAAERLLKKCKLKYRFSALEDGSLVWAKMPGYCKWPAVISPDPGDGRSRILDEDGEPLSYHIEFLGMKHSHAWVHTRFVELYGKTDVNDGQHMSQHRKGLKGRFSSVKVSQLYKGNDLRSAIEEADQWLDKTLLQRIKGLSFRYDPEWRQLNEKMYLQSQTTKQQIMAPPRQAPHNMKHFSDPLIMIDAHQECAKKSRPRVDKNKTSFQLKGMKKRHRIQGGVIRQLNVMRPVKNNDWRPYNDNQEWYRSADNQRSIPTISETYLSPPVSNTPVMSSPTDSTILTSPKFCHNGQSLRDKLDITNSLLNRTKEEKFTMDVEMFVQNQEAFDHDIRKFLKKNGCTLRRIPIWHDVPVTLYQMFLAVYDRGGYHKACENKQWASIYRELAGGLASSGSSAKTFYQRYLLPYETYLKKQEYKHLFKQNEEQSNTAEQKQDTLVGPQKHEDDDVDDGFSSCSELDELHTMLGEMEALTRHLPDYTITEKEDHNKVPNTKDITIAFYDDSCTEISQEVAMVDLAEFKEAVKSPRKDKASNLPGLEADKPDLCIDLTGGTEVNMDINNNVSSQTEPIEQSASDMFSSSSGSAGNVLEELVVLREEIDRFKTSHVSEDKHSSAFEPRSESIDIIDQILQQLSDDIEKSTSADNVDSLQIVPEVLLDSLSDAGSGLVEKSISSAQVVGDLPNSELESPKILSSYLQSTPLRQDHINNHRIIDQHFHPFPYNSVPNPVLEEFRYLDHSVSSDHNLSNATSEEQVLTDLTVLQQELDQMDVYFDVEN